MKRLLCMLLAGLLLLSMFACGAKETAETTTAAVDQATTTAAAEDATTTTAAPHPTDAIASLSFNNEAFRVAYPSVMGGTIEPTEMTGEILNDTSLERYMQIEEMLDVKFEFAKIDGKTIMTQVGNAIQSGDDAYDYLQIASAHENFISSIQQGMLYNLNDLPHLNLDASYMYGHITEQLDINGKLYFAFSAYNNSGPMPLHLVFNKDLMTASGMELPYKTILDGDWTWEVFLSYITDFAADLDGDGVMEPDDRYGYANSPALSNYLVFGYHVAVVERADNGAYVPSLQNEKLISAIQRTVEFTTGNDDCYHNSQIAPDGGRHLFMRGNALFSMTGSGALSLRDIENFDFGIAPFPKYDDDQKEYGNYLAMNPMAVPTTIKNEAKVGAVIEALSILSEEIMAPTHIEDYVECKVLRDEESVEVARMMMKNVCIDITRYYDFAAGSITPVWMLGKIQNPNMVASFLKAMERTSTLQAEKFFSIFFE